MKPRCGDCMWFTRQLHPSSRLGVFEEERILDMEMYNYGLCRRYPPVRELYDEKCLPAVDVDFYCGEFKENK